MHDHTSSYISFVHRHYITLNVFLLVQHLFIEKSGYCPLHIKDWRKVKNDNAETILQCIQVC